MKRSLAESRKSRDRDDEDALSASNSSKQEAVALATEAAQEKKKAKHLSDNPPATNLLATALMRDAEVTISFDPEGNAVESHTCSAPHSQTSFCGQSLSGSIRWTATTTSGGDIRILGGFRNVTQPVLIHIGTTWDPSGSEALSSATVPLIVGSCIPDSPTLSRFTFIPNRKWQYTGGDRIAATDSHVFTVYVVHNSVCVAHGDSNSFHITPIWAADKDKESLRRTQARMKRKERNKLAGSASAPNDVESTTAHHARHLERDQILAGGMIVQKRFNQESTTPSHLPVSPFLEPFPTAIASRYSFVDPRLSTASSSSLVQDPLSTVNLTPGSTRSLYPSLLDNTLLPHSSNPPMSMLNPGTSLQLTGMPPGYVTSRIYSAAPMHSSMSSIRAVSSLQQDWGAQPHFGIMGDLAAISSPLIPSNWNGWRPIYSPSHSQYPPGTLISNSSLPTQHNLSSNETPPATSHPFQLPSSTRHESS